MRGLTLIVGMSLCACDGGDGGGIGLAPDGPQPWGPVEYIGQVFNSNDDLGTLQVRIDGELGRRVTRTFDDPAVFATARITFELLDGDQVIESIERRPLDDVGGCGAAGGMVGAAPATVRHEICGYGNGELRMFAASLQQGGSSCIGDWFCVSPCQHPGCGAGTKCGASFASAALEFSRVACVPVGPRVLGEGCTHAAGSDGRFVDDCAADSVCVDGTCRATCEGACGGGQTCAQRPELNPEIRVCVATATP